jgi:hypothetical protein
MPLWLILAAAASIAIAALLSFLLYRLNSGPDGPAARRKDGDPGPLYADGGAARSKADHDGDSGDAGGGDGGGGGE